MLYNNIPSYFNELILVWSAYLASFRKNKYQKYALFFSQSHCLYHYVLIISHCSHATSNLLESPQFLFSSSKLLKSPEKVLFFAKISSNLLKKTSKGQVLFLLPTIFLILIIFNWLESSHPFSKTYINQYYYQSTLRCVR